MAGSGGGVRGRALQVYRRLISSLSPATPNEHAGSSTLHGGLARDAAGTLALNVAAVVLSFLTAVVLSRLMGRRAFGAYVYAVAWSGVLAIPALFGCTQLLIRNVAAYHTRGDWGLLRGIIRRCQLVVLRASLVVVLTAAAGGTVLMASRPESVRHAYLLGLLLVPLLALMNLRQAEMTGFKQIVLGRVPETLVYPLLLLGLIGGGRLVLTGHIAAPAAVGLNVVAATGALLVSSFLAGRTVPAVVKSASPEYTTTWSRSARALLVITAIPVLNLHSGTILLGAMSDVDSAAIFTAAVRCATFTSFLQWAAAFPLGPMITRLHATGDVERLEQVLSTAARVILACSAPIALGLLLFGGRALALFGDGFLAGRTALSILVAGEVVNVASGVVGLMLVMTGNERIVAGAGIVAVALNVTLSVALIPVMGLEGAALAQAVTTAGLNLTLLRVVWRRLRIYPAAIPRRPSRSR